MDKRLGLEKQGLAAAVAAASGYHVASAKTTTHFSQGNAFIEGKGPCGVLKQDFAVAAWKDRRAGSDGWSNPPPIKKE